MLGGRRTTGEGQGSIAAAIFWANTRCGWKETNVTELTGPDGRPVQTFDLSARERIELRIEQLATHLSGASRGGPVEAGALRHVMAAFGPKTTGVLLYYPDRHHVLSKLRTLVDH